MPASERSHIKVLLVSGEKVAVLLAQPGQRPSNGLSLLSEIDSDQMPASAVPGCKDGLDNDADGLADVADPNCGNDPIRLLRQILRYPVEKRVFAFGTGPQVARLR